MSAATHDIIVKNSSVYILGFIEADFSGQECSAMVGRGGCLERGVDDQSGHTHHYQDTGYTLYRERGKGYTLP